MPKELLFRVARKEFRIDTFRSGGKGGQNQNKVESGVRIVHETSGAVGESREQRSQWQNRCLAFQRLAESPRFRAWLRLETQRRLLQRDLEQEVAAWLAPEYLTVEQRNGDRWVPWIGVADESGGEAAP